MALSLPGPGALDTGVRYVVARAGPFLDGLGRVVIPTGVVRVVAPATPRTPAVGEIVAQFDVMSCTDMLLPVELPRLTGPSRPVTVANGATGRVAWIAGTALLPTLQTKMIVDVGTAAVKPGDQVTLYALSPREGGESAPGEVAVATVLVAGPRSATAVIIHQSRAEIEADAPVRVTAKLP
jgi:hypothetical protein